MFRRSVQRFANWIACAALLACGALAFSDDDRRQAGADHSPKTLYIWSGSQVRTAPAFLAVIDFDEESPRYGRVVKTVPIPPPYDLGNEPHHCHLSADKNTLACGGLLSVSRWRRCQMSWERYSCCGAQILRHLMLNLHKYPLKIVN